MQNIPKYLYQETHINRNFQQQLPAVLASSRNDSIWQWCSTAEIVLPSNGCWKQQAALTDDDSGQQWQPEALSAQ